MSLAVHTIPGLKIADVDDFGGTATLTLSVTQGTITVAAGTTGVSVISGSGVLTTPVVITGTITALNKLITGQNSGTIVYTSSVNGSKTFTIQVRDSTAQTTSISFPITVAAKVPPTVTYAGGTLTANAGVAINIHGASKFSVSDADAIATTSTMTFTVGDGVITVAAGNSGVKINSGSGTTSVALQGTLTSINALLTGTSSGTITYTGSSAGSKTFTVTVTDIAGQSDNKPATITVGSPPVVTVPTLVAGVQAVPLSLKALGFGVTDADDAGGTATCTVAVTVGTISMTQGDSGLGAPSGSGTASCSFTGTIAQINRLLTNSAATTGTLIGNDAAVQSGTITVTVVDSTSRSGTNNCVLNYDSATPTWQGYAQIAPKALGSGSITAFPRLIDLSTMPASWWAKVTSDGRDIRITLSINTTVIARDLINFDYVNKTGFLVTKSDASTSPTPLRLWVGTAQAAAPAVGTIGSGTGRYNAYDASIKAFWADGAGTDRTGYLNDLTGSGSLSAGDNTGPIGSKSTAFNGTTQYGVASASIHTTVPTSLLCFGNNTKGTNVFLVQHVGIASPFAERSIGRAASGPVFASTQNTSNTSSVVTKAVDGSFTTYAGVFSAGGVLKAYDPANGGKSTASYPTVADAITTTPRYYVGALYNNGSPISLYNGKLSCVMILNTAVSDDFVQHYHDMLNQSTFYGTPAWTATTQTGL